MSLSGNTQSSMSRLYNYCDTCGAILPKLGLFCVKCSPPEAADPEPEKGINFFQTCLRITLLVIIFIGIVFYKLEIKPADLIKNLDAEEVPVKMAEDEDYKIFFKVNVKFANLRDQPNLKTSKILFVLSEGTKVEILEQINGWFRIRSKKLPGKEARTGWLVSKLLDSEIK
jgi:hypothetical protein